MQFEEVNDRESAASLKDYRLYVKEGDRPGLEDDEFLVSDLVGMTVVYAGVSDEVVMVIAGGGVVVGGGRTS